MSPFFAIFLVLLLGSSSYAAGRLHGQLSYRIGYRYGYRQGYFDGERGSWNRRRTSPPAALGSASAPVSPTTDIEASNGGIRRGTTYTGASFAGTSNRAGRHSTDVLAGRKV